MFAFLYVKANSKKTYEEISFSSFFQKNADVSIFNEIQGLLSRKNAWLSPFSLWIPIALVKIYLFRVVLTWRKNLCI